MTKARAMQLLKSKFALIALVLLALFFAQLHFAQWQRKKEIDKLITQLTEQEETVSKKNQDFSRSLQYLQADNFKERTARQQLELKKEGEVVVRFQEVEKKDTANNSNQSKEPAATSNYEKWIGYFFSKP
jgi:hypothetical protein